jgi:hypothetical protein
MTAQGRVCIFAKPPVPGQVKTRLQPALGREGAAALARAFLDDTCAALRDLPWASPVLATTGPLDGAPFPIWPQGEGDLGARLERVLARALREAPFAIAVGTDSPGLPPRLLDDARTALADADAVIGPSADGGFYLLGLRRCPEGLLRDLPWSRADTCIRTLARLRERGFRVAALDPWFDVDRPGDLATLRGLLATGTITAPATARLLAMPRISVVIPVLDEERRIAGTLAELASVPGLREIIVVDGGSRDRTVAFAREFPVRVLSSPTGRARQMNLGAAAACGDVLLFLHADTTLPADAVRHVTEALANPAVVAGAFRTWTVPDGARAWFAPLLHLADLRSRYTRLPYGDQALFVRAEAFHRAGGFPEIPLMEDLAFSRQLRRLGRIRTVKASVRVSGRRFLARPILYTLAVNLFPLLYRLGVPPRALARLYGNVR